MAVDSEGASRPTYRAPALEKGLDLIELLADQHDPLTFGQIADALGRSKGELFRMLLVLEHRGYVERGGEGFTLSNKLFRFALSSPTQRLLAEAALPAMREIADTLDQSCHLAVRSGEEMVVIHRVEAGGDLGFAVRVGFRRPLRETASGRILLAFALEGDTDPGLQALRAAGHAEVASTYVDGITDLSVPILLHGAAVAALTIPLVARKGQAGHERALALLRTKASLIAEMMGSD